MARLFDGTDDVITLNLGGMGFAFGPGTMAFLIRRNNQSVSQRVCNFGANTGTARFGIRFNSTNDFSCQMGATLQIGPFTVTETTWVLVAITKATGTVAIRYHKYVFATNTWTHTDGAAVADSTAPTGTASKIGALVTSEFFNGDILCGGLYNVALTDAQIESLPFSLQAWWAAASPRALWLLDHATVGQTLTDITGAGANQNAIVGTAVATNHPPIWNRFDDAIIVTRQPNGGTTYTKAGALTAGGCASGADVFTAAEAGSLLAGLIAAGADVAERSESGALVSAALAAGADVYTAAELGALLAGSTLAGADVFNANEAGALAAGGLLAGTSAKVGGGKAGSLAAGGLLGGADVAEHAETGALTAGLLTAGTDAYTAVETGAVIAGALLSGADATTRQEAGSLLAGAILAGADVLVDTKTGSIVAGGLLAGTQAKEGAGKTGALICSGQVSGADSIERQELGALVSGGQLRGGDVYTAVEAGALVAAALTAGIDVHVAVESGSLVAVTLLAGVNDSAPPVTTFFGPPSPDGGVPGSNPAAATWGAATPTADAFGAPSPTQVPI